VHINQFILKDTEESHFIHGKRIYLRQNMQDIITSIILAFAALFVILDPILSVPIFATMTKGQSSSEIHRQAFIAVAVAGGLMYIFLIFNNVIFDILGLNIASFQIAGGILLFILGIQMALGIELGHKKDQARSAAGVVIGTPLLCGPGTITQVMLLSRDYCAIITFAAITLSLIATWLVLYFSDTIQRILGDVVTDIMGKVLGMFVAAIAIKIIVAGIMTYTTFV